MLCPSSSAEPLSFHTVRAPVPFSPEASSQTSFFPSLGSADSQHHNPLTTPLAPLQPLRQYMPHQLLWLSKSNLSFQVHVKIQLHPFQQSQSLSLKEKGTVSLTCVQGKVLRLNLWGSQAHWLLSQRSREGKPTAASGARALRGACWGSGSHKCTACVPAVGVAGNHTGRTCLQ